MLSTSVGVDVYPSAVTTLRLPDRPVGARGGRQVVASTKEMTKEERERALEDEILAGNVPAHVRTLVHVQGWWVTPDYIAVGSDDDYVRVPLTAATASDLATKLGMSLPSPDVVDLIYEAADVRMKPQPMRPGDEMASSDYYLEHNDMIERQLAGRTGLIAGHKKDLVTSPRGVAIYGWHVAVGKPIQPVSRVHGDHYADYSHGVRLVTP